MLTFDMILSLFPRNCVRSTIRQLELFVTGLRLLQDAKDIQIGYGTHPSEWDESGYPTTEINNCWST